MHACTHTRTQISKLFEVCTAQEEEANQEAANIPECNPDVLTRSQSSSGGLMRVCQMVGWRWHAVVLRVTQAQAKDLDKHPV